jgi:hypothetical protein
MPSVRHIIVDDDGVSDKRQFLKQREAAVLLCKDQPRIAARPARIRPDQLYKDLIVTVVVQIGFVVVIPRRVDIFLSLENR